MEDSGLRATPPFFLGGSLSGYCGDILVTFGALAAIRRAWTSLFLDHSGGLGSRL
ncbi:MAG: hypothetical protein ACYDBV_14260 [Nitrospiria bacterium]